MQKPAVLVIVSILMHSFVLVSLGHEGEKLSQAIRTQGGPVDSNPRIMYHGKPKINETEKGKKPSEASFKHKINFPVMVFWVAVVVSCCWCGCWCCGHAAGAGSEGVVFDSHSIPTTTQPTLGQGGPNPTAISRDVVDPCPPYWSVVKEQDAAPPGTSHNLLH